MLEGPIHNNRNIPGQLLQLVPGFGNLLGLLLGEALQRRDGNMAMGFPHLRQLGCVQPGKPGGFLESMFRGHDHHKQEVTRADVLKTETDQELTGDPSLHSRRAPMASPGIVLTIGREADTLALRRGGIELSLHKPFGMVDRHQPSGDTQMLRGWISPRRESRAWRRNREVGSAQPRSFRVAEAMAPWKPLFLCVFRSQARFSGNI